MVVLRRGRVAVGERRGVLGLSYNLLRECKVFLISLMEEEKTEPISRRGMGYIYGKKSKKGNPSWL